MNEILIADHVLYPHLITTSTISTTIRHYSINTFLLTNYMPEVSNNPKLNFVHDQKDKLSTRGKSPYGPNRRY